MTIWMRDVLSRERNDLSKITVLLGCLAVPGSLYSPGIFTTEGSDICCNSSWSLAANSYTRSLAKLQGCHQRTVYMLMDTVRRHLSNLRAKLSLMLKTSERGAMHYMLFKPSMHPLSNLISNGFH